MDNTDQRAHERVGSLNLSYVYVDEHGTPVREGMGRSLNVSESGMLLETTFYIAPDNFLLLNVAVEEKLLDIKGRVVHCRKNSAGRYQAGVEFTDLENVSSEELKQIVQSLRAQG